MNSDETKLWVEYQNGDQNALFRIYEILFPVLLRNGMCIVCDRDYVHGCIDQFFLYLWDKRKGLSLPDNLSSYLLASFKRYLLQDLKKQQRTSIMRNGQETERPYEDMLIDGQSLLELQLKLRKVMLKLPSRQRELIFLKYYQGLTCDQIAERTGLSHRTVYNRLYEALRFLRKEMAGKKSVSRMAMSTALKLFLIF